MRLYVVSDLHLTHHAPSAQSLPDKLKNDPASGAYASNMESFINDIGPRLWIHGHIHQPSSYTVGATQVVANPRGYPGEQGFRENFVITLPDE